MTIHNAPVLHPFPAPRAGIIERMDAGVIGRASLLLGAGRARAEDTIDFAVGFSQIKAPGEKVEADEPLFIICARSEGNLATVLPLLQQAWALTWKSVITIIRPPV